MFRLPHGVSARSSRVLWMLEEQGAAYRLKMLPFPPRATAREFLSVNPLGTVPAFFGGEPRMTGSAEICQYLAGGYALLLAEHLGLSAQFTPAVAAYRQRLRTRDAFQRALQAQERAAIAQGVSPAPAPDTPAAP